MLTKFRSSLRVFVVVSMGWASASGDESIPRPEHPRPDAVRAHWANLNGPWQFRFDPRDEGRAAHWERPDAGGFDQAITVPFGWESELSGIRRTDYRGVAWYRRTFRVPGDFPEGERVWLHFGAVDWRADVWVNGKPVASHEGGYSPFSADITDVIDRDGPNVVAVRAFDPTDPSLPTGKQIRWYTPTSGIWQTVWLESRPKAHIADFSYEAKIEPGLEGANYTARLDGLKVGEAYTLTLRGEGHSTTQTFTAESQGVDKSAGGPKWTKAPHLWTPETPYLYDVTLELKGPDGATDSVRTYFGLRTIKRGRYGDEPFERILLNGKPVYLRTALDQSFNPKGIYTAPDDAFLRRDIELSKSFGLNGLRIHIKPDEPRRLYWADKLGLLILEDMPNTWEQNAKARAAWEATMREVVARDRNHPSIVTWVAFNETWGLGTPPQYKADRDTQAWVGRMVDEIRELDPTRLVEDNSPCNYDHVENTDLNSWHFYIDDHEKSREHVAGVVSRTEPGSGFNYCPGLKQGTAPLINSEYGSVSAGGGDRDVSWGFRDLTTLLRRQPKVQGYVYTELSDIEWEHNGFLNYDRTPKVFGYDAFVPGMTVADLQGADFVGYDGPPAIVAKAGETITVPVFVSHYSDRTDPPTLRWTFKQVFDRPGALQVSSSQGRRPVSWTPYGVTALDPIAVEAPAGPCVGAVALELVDGGGKRIAANYVNVVVKPEAPAPRVERPSGTKDAVVIRFDPEAFSRRRWTGPAAERPGKVSGQGKGFYEYRIRLPETVAKARPNRLLLWAELASRAGREKVDWPERKNRQDYPQTDVRTWPTTVSLTVNGREITRQDLPDDPADARGVLSHLARVDHGSHGEVVSLGGALPDDVRADLAAGKPLVLRLAVPDDAGHPGGLSVYGDGMGAYSSDPAIVLSTEDPLPSDLGVSPDAPATVDSAAEGRVPLITPGDSSRQPTRWAYTTTDPGPGWADPGFDDSSWRRGPSGFGTADTPALRANTRWDSGAIWLRTTVECPAPTADDSLTLHLFHDEDAEILVNGKPLLRSRGFLTAYDDVALDASQKTLFRPGANTVAVSCRQTRGGQGVDVGLTLLRGSRGD
jgi:hypothetical protein